MFGREFAKRRTGRANDLLELVKKRHLKYIPSILTRSLLLATLHQFPNRANLNVCATVVTNVTVT